METPPAGLGDIFGSSEPAPVETASNPFGELMGQTPATPSAPTPPGPIAPSMLTAEAFGQTWGAFTAQTQTMAMSATIKDPASYFTKMGSLGFQTI